MESLCFAILKVGGNGQPAQPRSLERKWGNSHVVTSLRLSRAKADGWRKRVNLR
jgi:hypothetical protein